MRENRERKEEAAEKREKMNPLPEFLRRGFSEEPQGVDPEEQEANVRAAVADFFDGVDHGGNHSSTALRTDTLLSHFAVLETPEALADSLRISPCPDVVLRVAADGTTRGFQLFSTSPDTACNVN